MQDFEISLFYVESKEVAQSIHYNVNTFSQ